MFIRSFAYIAIGRGTTVPASRLRGAPGTAIPAPRT